MEPFSRLLFFSWFRSFRRFLMVLCCFHLIVHSSHMPFTPDAKSPNKLDFILSKLANLLFLCSLLSTSIVNRAHWAELLLVVWFWLNVYTYIFRDLNFRFTVIIIWASANGLIHSWLLWTYMHDYYCVLEVFVCRYVYQVHFTFFLTQGAEWETEIPRLCWWWWNVWYGVWWWIRNNM